MENGEIQFKESIEKIIRRVRTLLLQFRAGLITFMRLPVVQWAGKLSLIILIIGAFLFIILILPPILQRQIKNRSRINFLTSVPVSDSLKLKKKIESDIAKLDKQLNSLIPRSNYLVINSARNKFYLYRGRKLIYQGKCSTGSYILLQKGEEQKWLFKTPKGEFRVQQKNRQPVWKKPDWAFVEEGKPVPSANHSSRFEYGVLGDYSLSIGNGYLIHGTLYQRFLGLPVTHGCVRLNDADLEKVYISLNVGSRVYIY